VVQVHSLTTLPNLRQIRRNTRQISSRRYTVRFTVPENLDPKDIKSQPGGRLGTLS
jgi:hypothetical protein